MTMNRDMPDNLVKVYEGMIVPGQQLLVPLYSEQGKLLAQKGSVLDERQAVLILRLGEIYTERSSLLDALDGGNKYQVQSKSTIAYRFPPVFNRLDEIAQQMPLLFTESADAFSERISALLRSFMGLVESYPEASLAWVVLNQKKDILYHAVCCAVLVNEMVKRLEWKQEETCSLVSAALTMDCSLLLEKEAGLHAKGDKYYRHQTTSRAILEGLGVNDMHWLGYVNNHHCISQSEAHIPSWGESILFLTDAFCARLSGIYGDQAIRPHEALNYLRGALNSSIARLSFDALVSTIGVYPLGSIVLLHNEEVAIVTELTKHLDKPIVRAIYNKDGGRWQTPIIRKTQIANYAIREVLPSKYFMDIVDIHQFWQ